MEFVYGLHEGCEKKRRSKDHLNNQKRGVTTYWDENHGAAAGLGLRIQEHGLGCVKPAN